MISEWMKRGEAIYSHLSDDTSRMIFKNRLMYSFTGDVGFMQEVVKSTPWGEGFSKKLDGTRNYIFGAGELGRGIAHIWPGYFAGFVDNDETLCGQSVEGLTVSPPPCTV